VNCWACEAVSEAADGVTETVTGGLRVTVALADLVGSATLVAVTVTAWPALMVPGAV
jgi:hypothetical protein